MDKITDWINKLKLQEVDVKVVGTSLKDIRLNNDITKLPVVEGISSVSLYSAMSHHRGEIKHLVLPSTVTKTRLHQDNIKAFSYTVEEDSTLDWTFCTRDTYLGDLPRINIHLNDAALTLTVSFECDYDGFKTPIRVTGSGNLILLYECSEKHDEDGLCFAEITYEVGMRVKVIAGNEDTKESAVIRVLPSACDEDRQIHYINFISLKGTKQRLFNTDYLDAEDKKFFKKAKENRIRLEGAIYNRDDYRITLNNDSNLSFNNPFALVVNELAQDTFEMEKMNIQGNLDELNRTSGDAPFISKLYINGNVDRVFWDTLAYLRTKRLEIVGDVDEVVGTELFSKTNSALAHEVYIRGNVGLLDCNWLRQNFVKTIVIDGVAKTVDFANFSLTRIGGSSTTSLSIWVGGNIESLQDVGDASVNPKRMRGELDLWVRNDIKLKCIKKFDISTKPLNGFNVMQFKRLHAGGNIIPVDTRGELLSEGRVFNQCSGEINVGVNGYLWENYADFYGKTHATFRDAISIDEGAITMREGVVVAYDVSHIRGLPIKTTATCEHILTSDVSSLSQLIDNKTTDVLFIGVPSNASEPIHMPKELEKEFTIMDDVKVVLADID